MIKVKSPAEDHSGENRGKCLWMARETMTWEQQREEDWTKIKQLQKRKAKEMLKDPWNSDKKGLIFMSTDFQKEKGAGT